MQPLVHGIAPLGRDPHTDAGEESTVIARMSRLDLLPPGSLQDGCSPGHCGLPWRCNFVDLALEVDGKLRELGPWKPDERTERKLVWLTSFVISEEKRFALLSRSERKGSADELAETTRKLLGLERAQAFGVWLAKCLDETSKS